MARVKLASISAPEDHLAEALRAATPADRLGAAEAGLACDGAIEPDTRVLLLRQAYLAYVDLRQLRRAVEIADSMVAVGPLRDIAWHDKARALQALGDFQAAIEAQRLACRCGPPNRRSFHLWSLATLQHFAGDTEAALSTLDKGLRVATRDRLLLRGHAALICLERGEGVEGLQDLREALAGAPCGQGYGQFVLGMIAHHLGDQGQAGVHLQAFLRRNAQIDTAKALTLREELRRARMALASFASS